MADNKEIIEKDLDTVSGGRPLGGGWIKSWRCPKCDKVYSNSQHFPEVKEMNGVFIAYCTDCKQWIPKNEWHFTYR